MGLTESSFLAFQFGTDDCYAWVFPFKFGVVFLGLFKSMLNRIQDREASPFVWK